MLIFGGSSVSGGAITLLSGDNPNCNFGRDLETLKGILTVRRSYKSADAACGYLKDEQNWRRKRRNI
jgi:hypothetical protein